MKMPIAYLDVAARYVELAPHTIFKTPTVADLGSPVGLYLEQPWVGLTDAELMECTVFKRFEYDPPYIDKDGAKHVGSMEVSLRATYENINNKLKEKNT
jgi:hypothetical protein